MSEIHIKSKEKTFYEDLEQCNTLREILNCCIQNIDGQYLDLRLNIFLRPMAIAGIKKLVRALNVKF